MRILNCFTDPRIGGPGKRSIAVAEQLRSYGIDVEFLIPKGDDSLSVEATEAGFHTHRIDLPRMRSPKMMHENYKFIRDFTRTTRNILSLIESQSVDIVHVNTPYNFQTARAAAHSDAKLVWHFNDTLTPWPINRLAAYAAQKWADEIIVAADAVHDFFFDENICTKTVYAPVDINEFNPDTVDYTNSSIQSSLNIDKENLIIGAVGNINPIKGHDYLIDSISNSDLYDDVSLIIAGSRLSSQKKYYQKLQNKVRNSGLEKNIHFIGFCSEIPELLDYLDLFVLPSRSEACPIVVLEAMAMKCPIVATSVGGVPEQIPSDKYGWVVPPKDPKALSDAIQDALNSPSKREKRAELAHKRVKRVFSLEECTKNHLDIYTSLDCDDEE